MNVKRYLTEDEQHVYSILDDISDGSPITNFKVMKVTLESLAECRALLEKHEWVKLYPEHPDSLFCLECRETEDGDHLPDCAIATALQGIKGGT